MYAYEYDEETGGIVLNDNMPLFSKEPRPVYAQEMDYIGMADHWRYRRQNDIPYLWAESNIYWYRGKVIAKVQGGALYEQPVLEVALADSVDENGEKIKIQTIPDGAELRPVDIQGMVDKNKEIMSFLEQFTKKKIYNYYKRRKKEQEKGRKIDYFHVAFSGGKDSIVLLDLVKKALPRTSFMVIFGDTGMEFPDTYDIVRLVEEQCKKEGIEFYRASSHLKPTESWRLFGPPAQKLRWCCTVHKAAPQTIKIRKVLGKSDYVGVDYVGVRKHESATRADYDYESFGKKQKGQYSQNPILEWSSAEIWMYIYANALPVNETYKKGNSRAGCLFCPMGGGKADYFRNQCYPDEIKRFTDMIRTCIDDSCIDSYITNGGWINRRNGRDLKGNVPKYKEETENGYLYITVTDPKTDWREWIKTMGEISFPYMVEPVANGYIVKVSEYYNKSTEMKYFKQVFHKAAYCVGCRVCEANCDNGCISFENGLHIDNCCHCRQCHNIDGGCLVYHSLQMPQNGGKAMGSINTFADHAPKMEWVRDFFNNKDSFLAENTLGPMQIQMFKRFLTNAGLIEKNIPTEFAGLASRMGWDSEQIWGLILINLFYNNPQIRWYILNMSVGEIYERAYLEDKLAEEGVSSKDAKSIIKAFGRLTEIPLGTVLRFGVVTMNGRQIGTLARTKCNLSDHRVILYSLFKYAEACEGYYQFTLTRLLDHSIVSNGISPTQIFGIQRDEMEQYLNGLSVRYPDYINATFTHDLDKISLAEDKTSKEVLELFEE